MCRLLDVMQFITQAAIQSVGRQVCRLNILASAEDVVTQAIFQRLSLFLNGFWVIKGHFPIVVCAVSVSCISYV